MKWATKSLIFFWPGAVAIAYALLVLDGVWQKAMLNSMAVTYVAIAPLIIMGLLQDGKQDR